MKPAMKSRTIWLNWMVGAFITVAGVVMLYLPELGFEPSPTAWGMMGLTLAVNAANIWLRYRTDTGIG